jgi:hypothetical protein
MPLCFSFAKKWHLLTRYRLHADGGEGGEEDDEEGFDTSFCGDVDCYDILGLRMSATKSEIKACEYHKNRLILEHCRDVCRRVYRCAVCFSLRVFHVLSFPSLSIPSFFH